MSTQHLRAIILLSFLLAMCALFPSRASASACDVYGGNVYHGCTIPTIVWGDGYGNMFADKLSAAQSNYGHFRASSPNTVFNGGVKTAPVTYYTWGPGCVQSSSTDNSYLDLTISNGSVGSPYDDVPIDGFTPTTSSCGAAYTYHGYITGTPIEPKGICPSGYQLYKEGDKASRVAPFGWACKYNTDLSYMRANIPCSHCDMDLPGATMAGNPVLLGPRLKRDYAQDLRTGGPFPIVWSRTYSAEYYKGWKFLDRKRLMFSQVSSSTIDYLSFDRGDGSWLLYRAPPVTGTASHVWVSDMSSDLTNAVRSAPVDVRDTNGVLTGFDLVLRSGLKEHYDLSGKLLSIENAQGLFHRYIYNSYNALTSIQDDFGHHIDIAYVANHGETTYTTTWVANPWQGGGTGSVTLSLLAGGASAYFDATYNIRSVTDGTRTVNYGYSYLAGTGGGSTPYLYNLTSVAHADGTTTGYSYGETIDGAAASNTWLTGITDETNTRLSSYTYVGGGAMVTKEWKAAAAGARTETFQFGGGTLTDPLGNVFNYGYNAAGQLTSMNKDCRWCRSDLSAKAITYANNMPTSITDFNNVLETRTYNTRGLMLTRTQAYGTTLARTATYTWDATRELMLTKVEPIKTGGTPYTRTTTYTYNTAGQPLTEVVSTTNGEASRTTTYTYNSTGLLDTITNPRGAVTALTYGSTGDLASVTEAYGTSLARTTTLGGYTVSGLAGWVTEPSGLSTRTTYDAMDRVTKIERGVAGSGGPGGSGGTWETTNATYTPFGKIASLTRPDGIKLEWSYNVAHRVIQLRQKSAAGTLLGQIDYTLNAAGAVSVETASAGGVTLSTSTKTYDTLARLDTVLGAQAQVTDVGFDPEGNATSVKDPLNHTTSQAYDALNRVITTTDAALGVSSLGYDVQDNLVSATDQRSIATTYAYNAFNELLGANSPDRGNWSYTYDANGNPVTVTDPRGVVATSTYDLLDRPTSIAWDSSSVPGSTAGFVAGARSVSYTWDSCTNGVGRICSKTDHSGTTAYSYDTWGRLIGQGFVPAGETLSLATGYGYDAYGRRVSVTYPSGKTLTYTYGGDGRVSSQSWAGSSAMSSMTWQPLGGPSTGWTWAAAGIPVGKAAVSFTYDQDGRMTALADVDNVALVHDLDDRLTGTSYTTQTDKSQLYTYDVLDRLTQADNALWSGPVGYVYDAVGNRTNKTWNTDQIQQAYGTTNNRLLTMTPVSAGVPGSVQTRSLDAMGNTIDDGIGRTYGFDALGRMVSAASAGSGSTFVVGTDGLRTRKTTTGLDATDKLYAYDDQRRLMGVYQPDGLGGFTVSEELVYLASEWRLAGTVRGQVVSGSDGVFYPVLTDQIGAPRVVLDPTDGSSRWEWEAKEAFGYQTPNTAPGTGAAFSFDARFPGQWFDPETGLYQNGFRDYDPRTGRYVQSDPIGLGGGWNTYAYVGGQVTGAVDPFGLSQMDYSITIPSIMHSEVALMEREGRRRPGSGTLNAWLNNVDYVLDGFNYFHKGNEYLVCIGQADRLLGHLNAIGDKTSGFDKILDDKWRFFEASDNMHHWIIGISSNRGDPVLRIDPWYNSVTTGALDYNHGWPGIVHTAGSISPEWVENQRKAYSK